MREIKISINSIAKRVSACAYSEIITKRLNSTDELLITDNKTFSENLNLNTANDTILRIGNDGKICDCVRVKFS